MTTCNHLNRLKSRAYKVKDKTKGNRRERRNALKDPCRKLRMIVVGQSRFVQWYQPETDKKGKSIFIEHMTPLTTPHRKRK